MQQLTVIKGSQQFKLSYKTSDTILDVLKKNGFVIQAPCGGKGICKGCTVYTNDCSVLACQTPASKYNCIKIPDTPLFADIEMPAVTQTSACSDTDYGIAIDLGTTTVAFALVDLSDGTLKTSKGFPNPGLIYGADILNRIAAANQGKGEEIQTLMRSLLLDGCKELMRQYQLPFKSLKKICISANTVMYHLLLQLSCKTLGSAPFKANTLSFPAYSGNNFFGTKDFPDTHISLLPCLDAFIGGDITSGLFYLNIPSSDEIFLFVDLGTNGELVLGNQDHLLAASVAAGPAFEGSRIPGNTVILALAEMLEKRALDSTGLLQGSFFYTGYTYQNHTFLQEDIRSIQLAKASVRAGIETLLHNYGITPNNVDKVYLSGGFGSNTDISKAAFIGLLPDAFISKTFSMGNTSLLGAIKYLTNSDASFFETLKTSTSVISLADSPYYKDTYLTYMNF